MEERKPTRERALCAESRRPQGLASSAEPPRVLARLQVAGEGFPGGQWRLVQGMLPEKQCGTVGRESAFTSGSQFRHLCTWEQRPLHL